MNKEDLLDFLLFAGANGLMDRPVSEVYELWDRNLREIHEDMEADYWIEQYKAGMMEDASA